MAACSALVVLEDRRRYLELIGRANRTPVRSRREDARSCTVKRPAKIVLAIGVALDHKDREAYERRMFQEGSLARGSARSRGTCHQRRLLAEIGSSMSQASLTPKRRNML